MGPERLPQQAEYTSPHIPALLEVLQHQALHPLGRDPRSGACAKAFAYLLDGESFKEEMAGYSPDLNNPVFGEPNFTAVVSDIIDTRQRMQSRGQELDAFAPAPLAGLLQRAVQADQLRRREPRHMHEYADDEPLFPDDATTPAAWLTYTKNMLATASRAEAFYMLMYGYDLLSNIPQRAAALELGGRALQSTGLLLPRPTIYHVGCSQQDIEKKIKAKRAWPHPIQQYRPIDAVQSNPENGETMPFADLRDYVNHQLARRWLTGLQVGFDIRDPSDPLTRAIAHACRFYPSELLDDQRVAEVEELSGFHHSDIRFIYGDFLDFTPPALQHELRTRRTPKADIVFFSFSLYQQHQKSQQKQSAMLHRAREFLGKKGWIFVLDFVSLNPNMPTGMEFARDWSSEYLCRLLAIDGSDPAMQPHELFVFQNGRIERVRLGMALTAQKSTKGDLRLVFNAQAKTAPQAAPHAGAPLPTLYSGA